MRYDADRAIKRNVYFTLNKNVTGALVRVTDFGRLDAPEVLPLEEYDFPRDAHRYMDAVVARHLRFIEAHSVFDDDYLPATKPFLGIAEHSCFMGGEVTFGGDTSYHKPPLEDICAWREIKLDRAQPHYALLMECMEYLHEKSLKYGFFTQLRGADGPMDIANAVRGNDLLYDLYDEPEEVKAFMDFCADAAAWTFKNQRPFASRVAGGYISGMNMWMPGNSIGHISEDASCLCSPAQYAQFGMPYTEKLVSGCDFWQLHVHSLGRACIPYFARLPKLGIMEISSDPNQPTGLDTFKQYEAALNGIIVKVDLNAEDVDASLDFLKTHRTIINLSAKNADEAQTALQKLREHAGFCIN